MNEKETTERMNKEGAESLEQIDPKQPGMSEKPLTFNPSLAFKMGLVSLARFGVLHDFLKWIRV